jgi:NTE family protein
VQRRGTLIRHLVGPAVTSAVRAKVGQEPEQGGAARRARTTRVVATALFTAHVGAPRPVPRGLPTYRSDRETSSFRPAGPASRHLVKHYLLSSAPGRLEALRLHGEEIEDVVDVPHGRPVATVASVPQRASTTRRANVALGGGGVRGVGLVGAVQAFDEAGYRFLRVLGTSAGAVVGAFLAALEQARRPVSELVALMGGLDFARLATPGSLGRVPLIGEPAELVLGRSLYQDAYLRSFLGDHLSALGVRTFADLALNPRGPEDAEVAGLAPSQRYRLAVTVTDLTHRRAAVLPWDLPEYGLDPGSYSVVDAVLASTAIPFVFPPGRLKGSGGISTLVDGGVLDDVPIATLDATVERPPPWPTFAISLGGLAPAHSRLGSGLLADAVALVETLLAGRESRHLAEPCTAERLVTIAASGVSPLDFGLSAAQRSKLLAAGREAATAFLATWNFEAWLSRCASQS